MQRSRKVVNVVDYVPGWKRFTSYRAITTALLLCFNVSVWANEPPAKAEPSSETTAFADAGNLIQKPVWEFGIGAAHFNGFDYPASKDKNTASLGLPFFIYRGEVVRVAGRGVGAVAVEKPRVKLDVSLGGSLSAESSGNAARESMPDLDFLFELGPRLNVLLGRYEHGDGGISTVRWLNSVRGVVSTDFSNLDTQGFLLNTELEWKRKQIFGSVLDVQLRLDTQWASRKLQRYFYSVPEAFVTENRAAYDAEAGVLGSRLSLGIAYPFSPTLRVFSAVNFESYKGAANRRSPLFETDSSVSYAIAIVWTIRSSKDTIMVFDED